MGKNNRNKKPTNAIREALLDKMHSRMNNMKSARKSGTTPQMQKALNTMSQEELEDSKDMMEDFQKDMKGMKSNKAKKYLKNMMTGMDQNQIDKMSETVKQRAPGSSNEITKYINNQKSNMFKQEESKVVINPEKVYVPWQDLTVQQKMEKVTIQPKKKKKTFSMISISVPKITELRNMNTSEEVKSSPIVVSNLKPTRKDIDSIFSTCIQTEDIECNYVGICQRLKNLTKFTYNHATVQLQTYLLEFGHDVGLKEIVRVKQLAKQDYLLLPYSETTVVKLPETLVLNINVQTFMGGYCYIRNADQTVTRTTNCVEDSYRFMKKFNKVFTWVLSLVGHKLPFKWFCNFLQDIGIFLKKQDGSEYYFYLYGQEYPAICKDNISVPEIPYFVLQCKTC